MNSALPMSVENQRSNPLWGDQHDGPARRLPWRPECWVYRRKASASHSDDMFLQTSMSEMAIYHHFTANTLMPKDRAVATA